MKSFKFVFVFVKTDQFFSWSQLFWVDLSLDNLFTFIKTKEKEKEKKKKKLGLYFEMRIVLILVKYSFFDLISAKLSLK